MGFDSSTASPATGVIAAPSLPRAKHISKIMTKPSTHSIGKEIPQSNFNPVPCEMIKLVLVIYPWKNLFIEYLLSTSYVLETIVTESLAVNKWIKIPVFMSFICMLAVALPVAQIVKSPPAMQETWL